MSKEVPSGLSSSGTARFNHLNILSISSYHACENDDSVAVSLRVTLVTIVTTSALAREGRRKTKILEQNAALY